MCPMPRPLARDRWLQPDYRGGLTRPPRPDVYWFFHITFFGFSQHPDLAGIFTRLNIENRRDHQPSIKWLLS
jgi:hypothetical protein